MADTDLPNGFGAIRPAPSLPDWWRYLSPLAVTPPAPMPMMPAAPAANDSWWKLSPNAPPQAQRAGIFDDLIPSQNTLVPQRTTHPRSTARNMDVRDSYILGNVAHRIGCSAVASKSL